MQHVVVISTSFPDGGNGQEAAGTFVADFTSQLSTQVRVTVVAPSLSRRRVIVNEQLSVEYFAVPRLPLSLLKITQPRDWFAIVTTLLEGKKILQALVEREQIDLIFALWVLPSGYWARSIAQKNSIPYATWALGSDIWSLGHLPIIGRVLRQVLHDSYINFADGYQLAADVKKLSSRECHFLPSTRQLTVELEKKLAVGAPYTLAFLGRWHLNKGIDILLASLSKLSDQDWKQIRQVRIAGGGPLAPEVESACRVLKKQGRPIELFGYLDKAQATEYLTAADYVLIPSRIESIPVIFSDAMKCKSPVIAMPVGDLPELMQQFSVGYVADDITADDFLASIRLALATPCVTFETGLAQASARFDVKIIVESFVEAAVN